MGNNGDSNEPLLGRRSILKAVGISAAGALMWSGSASAATDWPDTLVVESSGTAGYNIDVGGDAVRVPTSADVTDSVSGGTVTGEVTDGVAAYRLSGDVDRVRTEGASNVAYGPDADELLPVPENELVITSPTEVDYTFTATGEIEPVNDGSDVSAEDSDSVAQNTDATWTADGYTGNGYGDSFRFRGDVTEFSPIEGDYALELNGEPVTVYELTDTEPPGKELVISSPSEVDYTFTVTGSVENLLDNGDVSAEDNDSITENADGTWTVDGYTGNGYGDSFLFEGDVTEFSPMDGDYSLELDGEPVTAYELTGTDPNSELVITSPSEVDYTFTATRGIEKLLDNGDVSAEDNDSITENADGTWTADGYTGNGYGDSFTFEGEVTDFSPMEGDYSLLLDGTEVTAYELTDTEPPSQDTAVVGGGDGYGNTVSPSEATVTVSSAGGLSSALDSASSGDVVYVDGGADINLGTTQLQLPAGVTLASDRGIDGAPGGHVWTSEDTWGMLTVGDNARVTGLRLSGPHSSYLQYDDEQLGKGIDVPGSGVEIDNCEVFGYSFAAIQCAGDTHVHHSNIHHNPMDGVGYAVSLTGGDPTIEYNYMNYNRHSVASNGQGGYTVAYNHVGPDAIDHVFDVHRPGGETMNIHHNTVEATTQVQNDSTPEAVAIRGVPDDVADIHSNWFHNPNAPKASPAGWDGSAITQVHTDSWRSVTFTDNQYGSAEPAADVGHPR